MKLRLVALRLAVAVLVCYASFFLFTQTSMYAAVTQLVSGALPGIQPDIFVFALLTVVVLVACLFGGKRSAHLIYWMSIFFYLPSALSVSGLKLEFFSWQVGTNSPQLFSVTALIGLAIVAGYLWFICTSWFEEAHRGLIERGGDRREVTTAVWGQVGIGALVVSVALLLAFAAFALGFLPSIERAFGGFPSPHVILGTCGGLLILTCISLYLAAARGAQTSGEKTAGPSSER
jgi:uncharacterized membrane protein YidH (DUF202 family)